MCKYFIKSCYTPIVPLGCCLLHPKHPLIGMEILHSLKKTGTFGTKETNEVETFRFYNFPEYEVVSKLQTDPIYEN